MCSSSYAGAGDVTVILHSLASIVNVIVARSLSCARGEGYDRTRAFGNAKRSGGGNRRKGSEPESTYKFNKGMGS